MDAEKLREELAWVYRESPVKVRALVDGKEVTLEIHDVVKMGIGIHSEVYLKAARPEERDYASKKGEA